MLPRWRSLAGRLNPLGIWNARVISAQRAIAEDMLDRFARAGEASFKGTVLVDGTWDHPNYWVRYSLLRRAVGLHSAHEIGLVGPYRVEECSRTFARLGIKRTVRIDALRGDYDRNRREALHLLSQTKTPDDILCWQLPYGFPAAFVYDGILKRQRSASVNLADPRLVDFVAEALGCLVAAEHVLKAHEFTLLALSHVINFQYAALAWLAALRGIPVILVYGEFGVVRFAKSHTAAEIYDLFKHPTNSELLNLAPSRLEALRQAGASYIAKRLAGRTSDISAIYAFQKRNLKTTRADLCKRFGWNPDLPIISVYVPTWFDYPHMFGSTHFRDFLDWFTATLNVAERVDGVNWLIKSHPCEEWYGGVSLRDIVSRTQYPHVQFVPESWSGSALVECTDGVVTYHGTAGIEYAGSGKPVLLADSGWYHDLGIALWPKSRNEYLEALARPWWRDLDLADTRRRAEVLAGWHFCRPAWQDGFLLEDDLLQAQIYKTLPELFERNGKAIDRELGIMRGWFCSTHKHYHSYKMSQAEEFSS